MGSVTDEGKMKVEAKEYGTVMVMFEPLPQKGLLDLLEDSQMPGQGDMVQHAPLIDGSGEECAAVAEDLRGRIQIRSIPRRDCSGKQVVFEGVSLKYLSRPN
jgi:hypothetical protein